MSTKITSVELSNSTADAPAANDSSAAVVTSAWVQALLAAKLTGGTVTLGATHAEIGALKLKWGGASSGGSSVSVLYSSAGGPAFTSQVTVLPTSALSIRDQVYTTAESLSGFTAGTPGSTIQISWFAVGT